MVKAVEEALLVGEFEFAPSCFQFHGAGREGQGGVFFQIGPQVESGFWLRWVSAYEVVLRFIHVNFIAHVGSVLSHEWPSCDAEASLVEILQNKTALGKRRQRFHFPC